MTAQPPAHCGHECVCSKYIDHTNTGATPDRECNGETWCFKPCPHDTRRQQPDVLAPYFDDIERLLHLPEHAWEDEDYKIKDKIIAAIRKEREQR